MAITPKFQVGIKQRIHVASKKFTDREVPREIFLKRVNLASNESIKDKGFHVLVYYGVGGIGKTSLINQLIIDLTENYPNSVYTRLDFIDPSSRIASRVLLNLINNISGKIKIRFPHFDLAYSIHFKKKNPDFVFKKKEMPFESEASIIGNILGVIDGLGVAGAVTGIVNKAYELHARHGLNKEVKKELSELEDLSPLEIEERLPAYFAYDLRIALDQKNVPVFAIFIDTYEALWSGIKNEAKIFTADAWIRELVAQLPGVIFVICGRERLRWEEIEPEWIRFVEQHLLDRLDKKDASEFLITCGVKEEDIRNKILSASNGHPYHLDLSVDTYFERKNQGVELDPKHFGSNRREILDRFLRNLETSEIETLKILSVPRYYNENIFEYLVNKMNTGYPITQFDDFNRFSFVSYDRGYYFIHNLMRDGLNSFSDKRLKKKVHELLAEYYDHKLNDADKRHSQDYLISLFSEALYHRSHHLTSKKYLAWLSKDKYALLKHLQLRGATLFLEECLSNIAEKVGQEKIGIELFSILVDMVHLKGGYRKAVKMLEEYLANLDAETIAKSDNMLHLFIRKIHHQMFYCPVRPLIEALLYIEKTIDQKKLPERYNEILFMIGGNLGVLSGDYKFARKWLIQSIRFSIENKFPDYLCRSLRKYSDILRYYGHLEMANKTCDWALNIARNKQFQRYEIYLMCSKGEILREQGYCQRAIKLFKQAQRLARKQGIKGWEAHTYLALAESYINGGDIENAKVSMEKAKKIYEAISKHGGRLRLKSLLRNIISWKVIEGGKQLLNAG